MYIANGLLLKQRIPGGINTDSTELLCHHQKLSESHNIQESRQVGSCTEPEKNAHTEK